jgi:hypothetical protein
MTGMLERLKFLFLTALGCFALVACPSPPPPPTDIGIGVSTMTGKVALPSGSSLNLTALKVQNSLGSVALAGDGSYTLPGFEGFGQLTVVLSPSGQPMLFNLVDATHTSINARTTAETLLYFAAGVYQQAPEVRDQLIKLLPDVPGLSKLENAITSSLAANPDSLSAQNPAVQNALRELVKDFQNTELSTANGRPVSPRGVVINPAGERSGVNTNIDVPNAVHFTNSSRRRAWLFLDRESFTLEGSSTATPSPAKLRDFEIQPVTGLNGGTFQAFIDIMDAHYGNKAYAYSPVDSERIDLPVVDGSKKTTYKAVLVGCGKQPGDLAALTSEQNKQRETICIKHYSADILLPFLVNTVMGIAPWAAGNTAKQKFLTDLTGNFVTDMVNLINQDRFGDLKSKILAGQMSEAAKVLFNDAATSNTLRTLLVNAVEYAKRTNPTAFETTGMGAAASGFNNVINLSGALLAGFDTSLQVTTYLYSNQADIWTIDVNRSKVYATASPKSIGIFACSDIVVKVDGENLESGEWLYHWQNTATVGHLTNPRNAAVEDVFDASTPKVKYCADTNLGHEGTDAITVEVSKKNGSQPNEVIGSGQVNVEVARDFHVRVAPKSLSLSAKVGSSIIGTVQVVNTGEPMVYTATASGIGAITAHGNEVLTRNTTENIILEYKCGSEGTFTGSVSVSAQDSFQPPSKATGLVSVTLKCWDDPKPPDPTKKNPKRGGLGGDPHFFTLDGRYYDFQAVGDYVVAKSTTDDLEIHARFERWGGSASVTNAVAVRVAGSVVEVYRDKVFLNGQELTGNLTRALPGGAALEVAGTTTTVGFPDGSTVTANPSSYSLQVFMAGERLSKLEGLLGDGDDNPSNDLKVRGGAVLQNPQSKDLYLQFRESWRVPLYGGSAMFHLPPELWDPFFPPNVVSLDDLDPIARASAEKICLARGIAGGDMFRNCVFDVALTGDAKFADYASSLDPNKLGVILTPRILFVPHGQSKTLGAFATGTGDRAVTWASTCAGLTPDSNTATFTGGNTDATCEVNVTLVSDQSFKAKATVIVGAVNGSYWDGGGDGHSWSDARNWFEDKLPSDGSDVYIYGDNTELSINLNGQTINNLNTLGNISFISGDLTILKNAQLTTGFKLVNANLMTGSDAKVFLNGQTSFLSGTLGGTGRFINNGTLSFLAGSTKFLQATLENAGTIKISDNLYRLNGNAGLIKNTGTLEFTNDTGILEYNTRMTLENSGKLVKSGGTGVSSLQLTTLTNTGTLTAQTGTLRVQDGTVIGGNYDASLNAILEFYGNITFQGKLTGAPEGTVRLANTTVNIPASESLHLQFAGTGFHFVSGTIGGTGALVIDAGSIFNLSAGSTKFLQGSLENSGRVIFGDHLYRLSGGLGSLKNFGTLEFVGDSGILEYNARINLENSGSIIKSGGAGISSLQLTTLTNTGLLEARTGTLRVQNGTMIGGTYNAFNGATLEFYGDITLKGTLTGAPAGTIQMVQNILIGAGEELHLKFTGTGINFPNGTIVGTGKLVNDAGNILNIVGGSSKFLQSTFENNGKVIFSDNLYRLQGGTGLLVNTGTLEFVNDTGILEYNARVNLENSGLVLKSGGVGISSLQLGTLNNTGTLEARTGTLRLQNGIVNGGTYNALVGATLEFYGDITLKGTLTGAPVGMIQMQQNILVSTGEEAHLHFTGTGINFLSGTIVGTGKLVNDANGKLNIVGGSSKFLQGTLENNGKMTLSDNFYHAANSTSLLTNTGTLEFVNDSGILEYSGRMTLNNTGTMLKSGGAGNSTITTIFTNTGTITEASGHFVFTP